MFVIGGILTAAGSALIGNAIIKSGQEAPAPRRGVEERLARTEIVDATSCPGFGADFVAQDDGNQTLGDVPARLRRLEELHESGVLTEQEYRSKRAALVGQL